jgi:hypothetical protein
MHPDGIIRVSPRHSIKLAQAYHHLVDSPPGSDFVVRTLVQRKVGDTPLMSAELVLAGKETRERFPRAREFPLHFRKTYFPASFHGDPQVEFDNQTRASELIGCPAPIGWSPLSFRSCFLPGRPFSKVSPFGLEPEEQNIQVARDLPLAAAAGLWSLLEQAYALMCSLHSGGFAHGDVELHNLIVCASPLEVLIIDFENAREQLTLSAGDWEAAKAADLKMILREAVFLQCALGPQSSEMAIQAWERMDSIMGSPNRFRREIKRQSEF